MKDKDKFLKALKEGVVTVEFRKLDSNALRIMPCTLNPKLSDGKVQERVDQASDNEHFAVWAMDKDAWRSFRVNTVEDWYPGYPKDKPEAPSTLKITKVELVADD